MKFLIVFVAIVALTTADLTDEQKAKLREIKEKCVKETPGLDESLIQKAKDGDYSDDATFATFMLCFGKELKFLHDDGTCNAANIKEKLALKVTGDVSAAVTKCCSLDHSHEAAPHAVHIANCLHDNLEGHKGLF